MPGFTAARVEFVGRRRELTSLRRWLVSVDATPHAMLILGEPGMGKTTLWFALLEHAEALGTTVAVSRPSRPESRLAFLVLADLLDDLITAEPEEFSALPEVQRDLLDAVRTGVATPGAQTWRGVAVAFLELLRSAATVRPVLLAIDDRQWSDASSARVLDFALSRCGEQPVRLLATQRLGLSEHTSPKDPDLVRLDAGAMVLGPLPETDLMRMLRRIGPVPPEVAAAAVDGSGANPFVALELARSLLDPPITGGRNPLPRSLHDIAGSRLRGLSDHGLIVCRLTCIVGRPTTRTLHGILGRDTADAGLDDADAAGVLELRDGLWAFRHPLLAAAVHDLIAPAVRRDLHARASTVVDDREERAWHLVEAATGPDEAVATEVTATARWLAERGAPDNALSLLAAAIRLEQDATPDTRAARQVDAAHALLALDRPAEAMDTARAALELADDPTVSARALQICAAGATELDGPDTAVTYLEQAMTLAADPATLVPIADDLGLSLFSLGRVTEATACFVGNAERARLLGDPALVAETRARRLWDEFQNSRVTAAEALAEARSIHPRGLRAAILTTTAATYADRPALAFAAWDEILDLATASGDRLLAAEFTTYRTDVDLRVGNLDRVADTLRAGRRHNEDDMRSAYEQGQAAYLHAIRGDLPLARDDARRAIALGESYPWLRARGLAALGFVELTAADLSAAADALVDASAADPDLPGSRHGALWIGVDLVEALAGSARLAEAQEALERLEGQAAAWGDGWVLAGQQRSLAHVALAQGDVDRALAHATQASLSYATLPYPLDHGRALLLEGTLHRRLGHRRDARETLTEALAVLDSLGAVPWAARTRAELARVGGRAPSAGSLTTSEALVARQVCEGQSNAEIAATLQLSVRTVESHLTSIYRKLGVASRTQLMTTWSTAGQTR